MSLFHVQTCLYVISIDPCMAKECGSDRKCSVTADKKAVCGMIGLLSTFLIYCVWYLSYGTSRSDYFVKWLRYLIFFFAVSTHVLDLVFALDGSSSLAISEFEKLKEFVIKSLSSYSISRENTHVGVIEYSDEVSVKLPLHQYFTIQELKSAISEIEPSSGRGVVTDEALKTAAEEVFSVTSGGRPGAAKVLIVVTDGASTGSQPISEAVKPLKNAGIQLHVVAIGNRIPRKELDDMATGDDNIHVVPTTDDLPGKTDDVTDAVDEGVRKRKSCRIKAWFPISRSCRKPLNDVK